MELLFLSTQPAAAARALADFHLLLQFAKTFSVLNAVVCDRGLPKYSLRYVEDIQTWDSMSLSGAEKYLNIMKQNKDTVVVYNKKLTNDPVYLWANSCLDNFVWLLNYGEEIVGQMYLRKMSLKAKAILLFDHLIVPHFPPKDRAMHFPMSIDKDIVYEKRGNMIGPPYSVMDTIAIYREYYKEYYAKKAFWGVEQPPHWLSKKSPTARSITFKEKVA